MESNMGHQDKGHYALKHPDQKIIPNIAKEIQDRQENGILTCPVAHRIAKTLAISPSQVGIQTDLLELRIAKCQLGLFGYGRGVKKIDPNYQLPKGLQSAMEEKIENGKIPCYQCWKLATEFKISRRDMGSACEVLKVKIKPCQLGAF